MPTECFPSCLTSAEESGTNVCQEKNNVGGCCSNLVESGGVREADPPYEEENECKFNIKGLFEVHCKLNESDGTWNDPR